MKNGKILSVFLIAVILICNISSAASDNTIMLNNKDDIINLSKNCTLDSWSLGKKIVLNSDIDMKGENFSPIPTFGGVFEGNGYMLSGINIDKDGSNLGVFRYIQKSGIVRNLNISGNVIPGGSKNIIGGIAGNNSGIIENCSVNVAVKGENSVGGIAGINEESGQIIQCSAHGSVNGENTVGGIAGENAGLIISCENNAIVNTVYEEKKVMIDDIDTDADALIENLQNDKTTGNEEGVLTNSDVGGIAGLSHGIVQGCKNNASVGYQHIGYNIGGIVGRQSGYLSGCENYGHIRGRKDVGGVVGQAEPYIILTGDSVSLSSCKDELDKLHEMVNKLISDSDNAGNEISGSLSNLLNYSESARDNTEILLNKTIDFADDNISEVNSQMAIISDSVEDLVPVLESLGKSTDGIAESLNKIDEALDELTVSVPDIGNELSDISTSIGKISLAQKSLNAAYSRVQVAVTNLKKAIQIKNNEEAKEAVKALSTAIKDINTQNKVISSSLTEIEKVISEQGDDFSGIFDNKDEIVAILHTLNTAISSNIDSLSKIISSLDTIKDNVSVDFNKLKQAAKMIRDAADLMSDAVYYLTNGMKGLSASVSSLSDKLTDYADETAEEIKNAKSKMSSALLSLSYSIDTIGDAVKDLRDIASDLASSKPLQFIDLGDDYRTASGNLFNSITDISNELGNLKASVDTQRKTLSNNLYTISNQFDLIMNLLINEIEDIRGISREAEDIFVDISDEDIESARQGKVTTSENHGVIEGDKNTGGIAGSMSIEYSKDPEEDIKRPTKFDFVYKTKAIVSECINDGEIIGKKDCTGGITGLAEIGTIYESENYGNVKSTSGSFVGGIAGVSNSTIRRNYSKADISGKSYIGGIVGNGKTFTSCYSIVTVSGDESVGAIAGKWQDKSVVASNFYLDNGVGAIDDISYKDKAEAITYDEMRNISSLPKRFISFRVSFVADGNEVYKQEVKYGDGIEAVRIPAVPEKKGQFGNWEEISEKTVTKDIIVNCNYQKYITILSSEEKSSNGKLAVCLADGEFTDKATLHATESGEKPPTHGNTKIYDIKFDNTNITSGDTVTVRLLNDNGSKVSAWRKNGDSWEKVSVRTRGKYSIIDVQGADSTVCLKYEFAGYNYIYSALILVLLLFVLITVYKIYRRSKKI